MTFVEKITVRGLIVLFLVAGLLLLRDGCKKFIPTEPKGQERLKDNEKERIAVNDRGDVVHTKRRKDGTTSSQVAYRDTGAGETVITLDDKGNIKVTQQTRGFVFRPGLCVASSGDGLRIGADIQFYYFRNFGANVGLTVEDRGDLKHSYRGYIAGSYRLPFESFRNTSLLIGIDQEKEIIVGARVRF